jgi:hypothetical protein
MSSSPPPAINVPTTLVGGTTSEYQGSTNVSLASGLTSFTQPLTMTPPNGGFPNMSLEVGVTAVDSNGVGWFAVAALRGSPSTSSVPINVTLSTVAPNTLPTIPITITVTLTYSTTGEGDPTAK